MYSPQSHEVIAFAQLRQEAGLPSVSGGLSSDPLWVAPVNARSENPGKVALMEAIPLASLSGTPIDVKASDLLNSFSWRKHAPHLLTPVVDQGDCGCCWAVAVTGSLNDRLAVKYGANPMFLFQQLMACTPPCEVCHTCGVDTGFGIAASVGMTPLFEVSLDDTTASRATVLEPKHPSPSKAPSTKSLEATFRAKAPRLNKLAAFGIPSGATTKKSHSDTTGGGLIPSLYAKLNVATSTSTLTSEKTKTSADGKPLCQNVSEILFDKDSKTLQSRGEVQRSPSILALQHAVLHHGPVVSIMRIYVDFIIGSDPRLGEAFESTDGVYVHRKGKQNYGVEPHKNRDLGTHCMVIVGWGTTEGGLLYWVLRNSWGERWCDKGYCKVAATSAALGNSSVGVDLAIKTVLNGTQKISFGNAWVIPDAAWSQKVYGQAAFSERHPGAQNLRERTVYRISFLCIVLGAFVLALSLFYLLRCLKPR